MTTFYLAAFSGDVERVQRMAADLEARGLASVCDWWRYVNAPPNDYPHLARTDVAAAKLADLFVLDYRIPTPGGMVELGVRLGVDKVAHVVLEKPLPHYETSRHFFFAHPHVKVHQGWDDFLEYIRPAALWGKSPRPPLFGATGESAPHGLVTPASVATPALARLGEPCDPLEGIMASLRAIDERLLRLEAAPRRPLVQHP